MVRMQVTDQLAVGSPEPAGARTCGLRAWGPLTGVSRAHRNPGRLGEWRRGQGCGLPCAPLAEHLGTPFALFLLSIVEDGLPLDTTEQLPDLCMNLLLALNLHLPGGGGARPGGSWPLVGALQVHSLCAHPHPFPSSAPDQNVIMAALSKHTNVKIFSEKLLLLLNRGGEGPGVL